MKIYDLSHKLNNQTPVYPGTKPPCFKNIATFEKDGFRETHFDIISHLGTHIDAPSHMIGDGYSLDNIDIDKFTGKALIIDIPTTEKLITTKFLSAFEGQIRTEDFILFRTGWNQYWGSNLYFENFPVLTPEAAIWLTSFRLKGIGFDAISADPVETTDYKIHFILLNAGLIIIENLNFPEDVNTKTGEFYCFPLPYENADGSPVRAVLKV